MFVSRIWRSCLPSSHSENMEHNVIEAAGTDTATACQPKEGALHSALQNAGAVVSVPVNSTDPVYILCVLPCALAAYTG